MGGQEYALGTLRLGCNHGTHTTGDWVNSRVDLDGCGKDISSPPGFELRIVQPVATHHNYVVYYNYIQTYCCNFRCLKTTKIYRWMTKKQETLLLCVFWCNGTQWATTSFTRFLDWYDIWCDIWYDMIWYIWYDMIWYDMTWHDMTWRDVTWRDVTWRDVTWRDVMWCDVMWCDVMWCDVIYFNAIGLTPGGSSTVHIYTNNTQNNTIH